MGAVGGGELFALDLVRELSARGFEQRLLGLGTGGELRAPLAALDLPVRFIPKRSRAGAVAVARLVRALRAFEPDVVQTHGEAGALWGGLAARLAGVPAVAALLYQLAVAGRVKRQAMSLLLRRVDRVQCGSQAVRHFVTAELGVAPERAVVRYCGIRMEEFRAVAERRRGRRMGDPPRLVTIGRLVPVKGHAVLLEACRRLRDRGVRVRLEIAGEGPSRAELEERIRELGLADDARLLGTVWPVGPVLERADLFVFPSLVEAQGLAPLEAFAAEVPVVASRVGGLPEVVMDGETGLLVPAGDAEALADAVARLLESSELRSALVRRASLRVEEFGMAQIAERFAADYDRLAVRAGSEAR